MTKRKREAEKAKGQRSKRLPFKAPNAAIKALLDPSYPLNSSQKSLTRVFRILQNATASPLLRLPLEIRNKIYAEVLGERLIHLKYLQDVPSSVHFDPETPNAVLEQHWALLVCDPNRPRSKQEAKLVDLLPWGLSSRSWQLCNRNLCLGTLFPRNVPFEEQDGRIYHREMHLVLLRTCRQVYTEATQILWSTNTFSFNDSVTFERFVEARDSFQKKSMQKLRLVVDCTFNGEREWSFAIKLPLIRSLQGLRHLEMLINHWIEAEPHPDLRNEHGPDALFETQFGECVRKLSILPLRSVHVKFVSEDMHLARPLISSGWTEEDRREYASVLRARLMDPHSADNYKRDQQELREKHRQEGEEKQHRRPSTLSSST